MQPPQLQPTGISGEYWHQYDDLCMILLRSGYDLIPQYVVEHPLQSYETLFQHCEKVITRKNRERVQQLDAIANVINHDCRERTMNEDVLLELLEGAHLLIYGIEKGVKQKVLENRLARGQA